MFCADAETKNINCPLCAGETFVSFVSMALLIDHLHRIHDLCFCGRIFRYESTEARNQAIVYDATAQAFEDLNAKVKNPFLDPLGWRRRRGRIG